jgi:hypothetical protein
VGYGIGVSCNPVKAHSTCSSSQHLKPHGLFIFSSFWGIHFSIKGAPPQEAAASEEDAKTAKKAGEKDTYVS